MTDTAAFYRRTFRIWDAMLLTLVAAIAIVACRALDPGWYESGERRHILLLLRVAAMVISLMLTALILLYPAKI